MKASVFPHSTLLIITYICTCPSVWKISNACYFPPEYMGCYLPWVGNQFAFTFVNLFILLICVRFLDTTLNSCRESNSLCFSTATENTRPQPYSSARGTLMACGLRWFSSQNQRPRQGERGLQRQEGAACLSLDQSSMSRATYALISISWWQSLAQGCLSSTSADGPAAGLAGAVVVGMEAKLLQGEAEGEISALPRDLAWEIDLMVWGKEPRREQSVASRCSEASPTRPPAAGRCRARPGFKQSVMTAGCSSLQRAVQRWVPFLGDAQWDPPC